MNFLFHWLSIHPPPVLFPESLEKNEVELPASSSLNINPAGAYNL